MEVQKDIREFIESFHFHKVEFLLVGGYAMAFHGYVRFTEDIDFFIAPTPENSKRILAALKDFGIPANEFFEADFQTPEQVIQIGRSPNRIDILTSISGVSWDQAWKSKIKISIGGIPLWLIGKNDLIANKLASARPQDVVDASRLQAE